MALGRPMYLHLVAIGWMFVVLMMSIAEVLSSHGSVLGAVITFVLYGVLPLAIVLYILGTPARKRARRRAEAAASPPPDGGGHAARDAVASEREEA